MEGKSKMLKRNLRSDSVQLTRQHNTERLAVVIQEKPRESGFKAFVLLSLALHSVVFISAGLLTAKNKVVHADYLEVSIAPFVQQKASPGKVEETKELRASGEEDVKIKKGEVQTPAAAGKEQAAADGAAVQGTKDAAFLDMLTVWKAEVRLRIRKALKYPKILRELNLEGTVTVDFTVDRAGYPANIIITSSSGVKTLDDTAVRTVSRAAPYPTPLEFGEEKYSVSIPIAFKLTE